MKMFTFSLTLMRHGETQNNRDDVQQGQSVDSVLSETGVQQAAAVGRYLRDITFNNVFYSPLQRAVRTAEIILRNNDHCSGTEMISESLLIDRCFGITEGCPKEIRKNMANASGQSLCEYTPPGGETLNQVRLRFQKFLQVLFKQMLDEHGFSRPNASAGASEAGGSAEDGLEGVSVHALVVTHGAYVRVAVLHLLEDSECPLPAGVKMSQLFSLCPYTGISRFVLTLSQSESGPVLSAARCVFAYRTGHLRNLTAAE